MVRKPRRGNKREKGKEMGRKRWSIKVAFAETHEEKEKERRKIKKNKMGTELLCSEKKGGIENRKDEALLHRRKKKERQKKRHTHNADITLPHPNLFLISSRKRRHSGPCGFAGKIGCPHG
jgi:hypothetical protein